MRYSLVSYICEVSENDLIGSVSRFQGVHSTSDKFVAVSSYQGKRWQLGTFADEEKAARAVDTFRMYTVNLFLKLVQSAS